MSNYLKIPVEAKENSTTRGVGKSAGKIELGTLLRITCSPENTWNLDPTNTTNANGTTAFTTINDQTFSDGCLVGSFNNGKTFFSIGTFLEMTVNARNSDGSSSVELLLYCWDSDNENNSDYLNIIIETFKPSQIN